jgi:hypothetical protein
VALVIACFQLWSEEHSKVEAFKAERPYFSEADSKIDTVVNPLTSSPVANMISIRTSNTGSHTAKNIIGDLVILPKTLDGPQPTVFHMTNVNDFPHGSPYVVSAGPIEIRPNTPPQFICFQASYDDSQTNRHYTQEWYFIWPGSGTDKVFVQNFFGIGPEDRAQIVAYLRRVGITIMNEGRPASRQDTQ